ncbi:glycoside hydrolase domain-containing protein [Bacteroides sp.]
MHKAFYLTFLLLLTVSSAQLYAQKAQSYPYAVAQEKWAESFGNHRAVLQIDKPAEVVALDFDWRRPDKNVDQTRLLIVDATTGDTVSNVKRMKVNNDRCRLQVGPVKEKGTYYFYYLPYKVQHGYGFCSGGYLPKEQAPADEWMTKANAVKKAPQARVIRVEARSAFDSFYPMEVAATMQEKEAYLQANPAPLYLFAEDRKNPIRMRNNVPAKWLADKQGKEFAGEAAPNEYYTFQIGVWAGKEPVKEIGYKASALTCGQEVIPANAVTCFNVEGTDPYGKTFDKKIHVAQGKVQPLWFGIDIPATQRAGTYKGTITVSNGTGKKSVVPVSLRIAGTPLADRGDNEAWRHSRLRWLNSTLGIADTPTAPYTGMAVDGNRIGCLGRTVTIDMQNGLPAEINSWGTEVLESPVRFIIRTAEGVKNLQALPELDEQTTGHVAGSWTAEDTDLTVSCREVMEFDGWMNYVYTLTPKKDIEVKDIRLEIPVKKEVGAYFLGMGLPGQETPQQYEGKWDTPEKTVNHFGVSIPTSKEQQWLWPFDSFWIGNEHAGIHCEFRGSTYSGPLLNLYRPAYPDSWYNGGKGGFSVRREANETKVVAYSGARTLHAGKPVTFDFAMIITPVKPLDMKSQFTDRYYHNGPKPAPSEADLKDGVRIINVHQGNEYNPFINYPFLTVDKMKAFTKEWHAKGCKVKMYYTLRELSNAVTELWAIRSLGHEILRGGNRGGYAWLREHCVTDYTPQWYEHFEYDSQSGIAADAAMLTAEGDSRWYNYYIEGLAWMVRNLDIDGIYLDDVSFDRRILKRMRRAMESVKPGCLIDLHSNTGFSKGPANQYAEFFPYVDKVWFGESFLYNKMSPANYLVESSGIPFGLTGDMLHAGGNAWLGMQYGMTVRYPWYTEGVNCDPRAVWKIWDEFGIADATMLGFWEEKPAVSASSEAVKITAYRKPGRVLLSVGNYSDTAQTVILTPDWEQLGLDPLKVKFVAPAINGFQEAGKWEVGEPITVLPRKGWLIYIMQK